MDVVDCAVIGGGVVGCTIAAHLGSQGVKVLLVDDRREFGGSGPSGGHMRPSWFGEMKPAQYEPAMELLNGLWGIIEEDFVFRPTGEKVRVSRVSSFAPKNTRTSPQTVQTVESRGAYPEIIYASGDRQQARKVIVAAGVWSAEVLAVRPETIGLKSRQGVSFRVRGSLKEPFIDPWAPYKQIVAHQQSPGEIWVGDGSAVYPRNWQPSRTQECLARCMLALEREGQKPLRTLKGYRPYASHEKDVPCLIKPFGPNVWLVTGSGKLGTIAAGWAALRMGRELG